MRESKINNVLRSAASPELCYAFLRAIEIMARDPFTRDEWRQDSTFMEIIQFYISHQQPEFGTITWPILFSLPFTGHLLAVVLVSSRKPIVIDVL